MRHFYKSPDGSVYEYESVEDRERFGAPDLVAMTQAEIDAHLSSGGGDIEPPSPSTVRAQRDSLLENVYDRGINMAMRARRLAANQQQIDYIDGLISQLDAYAEALTSLPEQPGFPADVVWPVAPNP